MTIPLFKTQYSIGKSILTPDDLAEIYSTANIETLTIVEDSLCGLRSIQKVLGKNKISFEFGLRLSVVQDSTKADQKASKLIFFAANNEGLRKLKTLYTSAHTSDEGNLSLVNFNKDFFEDVLIAVPFYDSFVSNNIFHFGLSELDLSPYNHIFFVEDNQHPFDFQIKEALDRLGVETIKTKSIYYNKREDFHAFQMFKAVCDRRQGRPPVFSNPSLNHFCSEEFCWESHQELCNA